MTLGNHQVKGVQFNATFAPIAKMVTVHTLLSLAAANGWALHQMDIHNAFLHGDLDEEIYMKLPPGFQTKSANVVCKFKKSLYGLRQARANVVCKFKKSLYGLRQAPRQWFFKLTSALRDYGVSTVSDGSFFIHL